MSNDAPLGDEHAHHTSVSDPLSALGDLVARLGQTIPMGYLGLNLSPEEWHVWAANWACVRADCRTRSDTLFSELRRWLRSGLDDDSFTEARREVDRVRTLVAELASASIPPTIPGFRERVADVVGTDRYSDDIGPDEHWRPRMVIDSLQTRPLADLNRDLQTAVAGLARWRDCRHQAEPDAAPNGTQERKEGAEPPPVGTGSANANANPKSKRSTSPGETRAKIISTLTRHHKYAHRSCLNSEPIGVNVLARQAKVSADTASKFFVKHHGEEGHGRYKAICLNGGLLAWLKVLNDDFAVDYLHGNEQVEDE